MRISDKNVDNCVENSKIDVENLAFCVENYVEIYVENSKPQILRV